MAATKKLLICPVFLCLSNSVGVVHQFDWHGTTSVFSGWLYAFGIIDFRNDPQMQSTAPTAEASDSAHPCCNRSVVHWRKHHGAQEIVQKVQGVLSSIIDPVLSPLRSIIPPNLGRWEGERWACHGMSPNWVFQDLMRISCLIFRCVSPQFWEPQAPIISLRLSLDR